MCLILLAYKYDSRYQLVLAANRDEYYQRASAPLNHWSDRPDIVAGRDLVAQGTWLGANRAGHVAAITNYREPGMARTDAPSRGDLVADFLKNSETAQAYIERLAAKAEQYNGFNLLLKDDTKLIYFSNRDPAAPRVLRPGLYGLSNHLLDTPWPKLSRGREQLAKALNQSALSEHLLNFLQDRWQPSDAKLPATGLSQERERMLASIFVQSPSYGTRSSTALIIDNQQNLTMTEKNHDDGQTRAFSFRIGRVN